MPSPAGAVCGPRACGFRGPLLFHPPFHTFHTCNRVWKGASRGTLQAENACFLGVIALADVTAIRSKPRAGPPASAVDVQPQATIAGPAMSSVAFSRDGRLLAVGSWNTVQVWDQAARKQLFTLQGHRAWVWTVAFSPDSNTL